MTNINQKRILITGGAGFIGSHLADTYLNAGYSVRILDNLTPQVHGSLSESQLTPDYLSKEIEFIFGDICDRNVVKRAIRGIDCISHHAAAVGVGQSMYEIEHYTRVNALGAAVILDVIANEKHNIRKMIVASSMSIYGEGTYKKPSTNTTVFPVLRSERQFNQNDWEMHDDDGETLAPLPTKESKAINPLSVYAINKRDHEEMFLLAGKAYNIPTVALRYFNVFGSRQSLSNPYTGVMAIFCSRLLNNKRPIIFEDGLQQRDFVSVKDVAQANMLATERPEADFQVFNIGSGHSVTILDVAQILAQTMGKSIEPEISGKFRIGDIRHCFADISKAKRLLGFKPQFTIYNGIQELVNWVEKQISIDTFDEMNQRLYHIGLIR